MFSGALLFEECNVSATQLDSKGLAPDEFILFRTLNQLVLILKNVRASNSKFIRKHHLTLSASVSYTTVTCQIRHLFTSLLPKVTISQASQDLTKMQKLTAQEGAILFVFF